MSRDRLLEWEEFTVIVVEMMDDAPLDVLGGSHYMHSMDMVPPAYDVPPGYAPPAYDEMDVVPSAPTESVGVAAPGTETVAADDYPIATAPTGYDEGGSVLDGGSGGDEVSAFLNGMGSLYFDEYYRLFMDNGFDTMELIRTLTEDELKNEIGILKLGHRRKIWLQINTANINGTAATLR